jgi:hypothetical protein
MCYHNFDSYTIEGNKVTVFVSGKDKTLICPVCGSKKTKFNIYYQDWILLGG